MKIMVRSRLESMLYEATETYKKAEAKYKSEEDKFFNHNGNPNDLRKAKSEYDEAMQRLTDLETAKRIIKEIEDKGDIRQLSIIYK